MRQAVHAGFLAPAAAATVALRSPAAESVDLIAIARAALKQIGL